MSSLPSAEGVDEVRKLIKRRAELSAEISEIKKQAAKLDALETEGRIVSGQIIKKLECMDVKSDGNMGWEMRVLWFLTEFGRQSEARS